MQSELLNHEINYGQVRTHSFYHASSPNELGNVLVGQKLCFDNFPQLVCISNSQVASMHVQKQPDDSCTLQSMYNQYNRVSPTLILQGKGPGSTDYPDPPIKKCELLFNILTVTIPYCSIARGQVQKLKLELERGSASCTKPWYQQTQILPVFIACHYVIDR